jgi:hypothetical protein
MELIDEIVLLVDNKLNDTKIVQRLEKLINDDKHLREEYIIQKSVKNLLNERLAGCKQNVCTCAKLKNRIEYEIKNIPYNKKF